MSQKRPGEPVSWIIGIVAVAAIAYWFSHRNGHADEAAANYSVPNDNMSVPLEVGSLPSDLTNAASSIPPPLPIHGYSFEENGLYGYIAEVSEEDRRRGVVAGHVNMYAFRGRSGNVYTLTAVRNNGALGADYECTNPCTAIREVLGGYVLDRLAYSPASIIGSAFDDAFAGRLRVNNSLSRPLSHARRDQLLTPPSSTPPNPEIYDPSENEPTSEPAGGTDLNTLG